MEYSVSPPTLTILTAYQTLSVLFILFITKRVIQQQLLVLLTFPNNTKSILFISMLIINDVGDKRISRLINM